MILKLKGIKIGNIVITTKKKLEDMGIELRQEDLNVIDLLRWKNDNEKEFFRKCKESKEKR